MKMTVEFMIMREIRYDGNRDNPKRENSDEERSGCQWYPRYFHLV